MEEVLVGLATAGVRSDAIEQERGGQVRGGFVIGGRRGDLAEGRAHWCGGHPSATEGPAGGQGGGATGAKGGEGPLRGGWGDDDGDGDGTGDSREGRCMRQSGAAEMGQPIDPRT